MPSNDATNPPPLNRAKKRKFVQENELSRKRLRSRKPVGLSPNYQKKQKNREPDDSNRRNLNEIRELSPPNALLSEENLDTLQRQLEKTTQMEPPATPLGSAPKRGPSRQPSNSKLSDKTSTRSQQLAGSLKFYRYNILARARVYISSEDSPAGIQSLLAVIFRREIAQNRRREISRMAMETARKFSYMTRGAHREDDLIETLYEVFCKMFPNEVFNCPRKSDWDPNLKPDIQRSVFWNLDTLGQANNEVDNVVERPSKRQQTARTFPSPDVTQSTSQQPVPTVQPTQDGIVKTPRPDFTIGFQHSTITNALINRGLSRLKADDFLGYLQEKQVLISDPTMDYLNVRFPIQVFEGKAYATGKTLFEAENQAAVSGACMVNLQQQLIDFYTGAFPQSDPPENSSPPLAFSICTEGPVIQFYAHYSLKEEGVRTHCMKLLSVCNGTLAETLEGLLMKWEQLMDWYGNEHFDRIVDRVYNLANRSARS